MDKCKMMKEKLIKLLNEGHFCWQMGSGYDTWEECIADHLLANGVIVLPCNVGDTVYFNTYKNNATVCVGVQPHKVITYRLGMVIEGEYSVPTTVLPDYEFGRSVFLTREEAEAALKEGKG